MTKAQRLEVYKEVLKALYTAELYRGICGKLFMSATDLKISVTSYDVNKEFPEFYRQKPLTKPTWSFWWEFNREGTQCRIKAMKKAIELCESPKTKKK